MSRAVGAGTKPAKKRPRPGNRNRQPSAWQRSATFKNIASNALRKFNANRRLHPRCNAHAKSTGEPCRQLALENGRCHWHGGRTPKGWSGWGRRQVRAKPKGKQTASDWRKVEAKLQRRAAEDRDRVRRLRAMSDDQFYRYTRRMGRRLDDPYSPVIRKAVKDEFARRGPDPSRQLGATTPTSTSRPADPELHEIEERIAELRAELQTAHPRGGVFD